MNDLPQFLKDLGALLSEGSTDSLSSYNILVSLVSIVIFSFFVGKWYLGRFRNIDIGELAFLVVPSFAVSVIIIFIFPEAFMNNLLFTAAASIMCTIACIGVRKVIFKSEIFKTNKNKVKTDDKKEKNEDEINLPENSSYTDLTIIDILKIYGYTSEVQNKRLLSYSVLQSNEKMAEKFLEMTVITHQDYREAKILLNIAHTERRLATRDEVKKILQENDNNHNDNNNIIITK